MKVIALFFLVAGASANYGGGNMYSQQAPQAAPVAMTYQQQSAPSYAAQASPSYAAPSAPAMSSYGGGSSYGGSSGGSGSSSGQNIPITSFNQEIRGSESSSVSFEAGNGIKQSENTRIVQGRGSSYTDEYGQNVQSNSVVQKSGTSSYTSPEGQQITLTWTADENGFHPQGAHLPTPPPVPAEIQASLRGQGYGGSQRSGGY